RAVLLPLVTQRCRTRGHYHKRGGLPDGHRLVRWLRGDRGHHGRRIICGSNLSGASSIHKRNCAEQAKRSHTNTVHNHVSLSCFPRQALSWNAGRALDCNCGPKQPAVVRLLYRPGHKTLSLGHANDLLCRRPKNGARPFLPSSTGRDSYRAWRPVSDEAFAEVALASPKGG